jgi:hypothetical protein
MSAAPVKRAPLAGPAVWTGQQIQNDPAWIVHLDAAAVAEIDAALAQARRAGVTVPFAPAAFPLPRFSATLDRVLGEVVNGRGFVLLRGIPRGRYSDEECELIYWGIGARLGNPVSQNARGHRLGHVRDEGRVIADPNARVYQTNLRMDFHCDLLPVDVLGLFCLRSAKSGGASKVVSALAVHNALLAERPDLLEALFGDFHVDWRGEEPEGEQPWYTIPMFSVRDGKLTSRICARSYFLSAARFGEAYRPTPRQLEALDAVQEIANRREMMLTMDFQEGDIQLINNHVTLHARDAYEDYDEPGRQRHLLRMWIAVEDARRHPLSDALAGRYRWVERGGIPVKA